LDDGKASYGQKSMHIIIMSKTSNKHIKNILQKMMIQMDRS
jgi:hypothetical protein